MKVYLAARFDRGPELLKYRDELEEIGITVTSRWLTLHGSSGENAAPYGDDQLSKFAHEDLEDIYSADLLIAFTEKSTIGYTSGGRHIEVGYALGHERPVIAVGPAENIFFKLTNVPYVDITVVPTWHMALAHLLGRTVKKLEAVKP